ncbi:MAG: fructose-6-phosphate aldolase [Oscillospiraceae bacterium]|nr:fructose-6-phosphate aldolase [Oscillospiraceae bacterium]
MLYIIDSANVEAIKKCLEFYPISGVTTNPSIISREKTDFVGLIRQIREVIGPDRMLHIQTTSTDTDNIVRETYALTKLVESNLYIKIPISPEGLKATMRLKKEGFNVTMTAIFTQQQAFLAAQAGADFVAPYVNRLDNIASDGVQIVKEIVELFKTHDIKSKVLAASFKNVEQVHKTVMAGAQSVTISPDMFDKLLYHPLTLYAMDDFEKDWDSVYNGKKIIDLIEKNKLN